MKLFSITVAVTAYRMMDVSADTQEEAEAIALDKVQEYLDTPKLSELTDVAYDIEEVYECDAKELGGTA